MAHLKLYGLDEIKRGKRKFHPDFEPFDEKVYLEAFPEVYAMVKYGKFSSVFDHFCQVGYVKLILDNVRLDSEEENLPLYIMKKDMPINKIPPYSFSNLNIKSDSFVVDSKLNKTTSLKIAVSLHIFHLDILPDILSYLKNIPYEYTLFITVETDKKKKIKKLFSSFKNKIKIITVDNFGYDTVPFIKTLPYIFEGEYDIVCKIHTKKGVANLEKFVPGIDKSNLWFKLLIEPLLGSEDTVRKVISAFEKDKRLGMLGSASMYNSLKEVMRGNEHFYADILNVIDDSKDTSSEYGFFAGTMFWTTVDNLFPVYEKTKEIFKVLETDSTESFTGALASPFHALERIMGVLPLLSNMKTALSYAVDRDRTIHNIQIVDPSLMHRYTFPLGVGLTLTCEHNISTTLKVIENSSDFNREFYLKEVPEVSFLEMDPLYHYCRYGYAQNRPPNTSFSTFGYFIVDRRALLARMNPLEFHLVHNHGKSITNFPPPGNIKMVFSYIKDSNLFDSIFYLREYPEVLKAGMNALYHYCMFGWKEDRFPSADFDPIWYTSAYLFDSLEPINPLLHYILIGRHKNYLPKMKSKKLEKNKGIVFADKEPSRICLFAAYDPDGIIDDYAVDFIKELSKYSDVYYLMDYNTEPKELKKLYPYVKKAWGFRHGEYDFGSYSRLAQYLVGWDKIDTYDELLLVNDSSYLIRPLDGVFNEMNKRKCDWWGMQATKGLSATKECKSNKFAEKIPIDIVKEKYLETYEKDDLYDFHIGSYFLVFRENVIKSDVLRRILNNVKKERNKKNIIFRYEIGLTKHLIHAGFTFDTYVNYLYPFHPIYTNNIFNIIKDGYPFFKKFFLTENHYHVPELRKWKEKLIELIPDLDLKPLEQNLYRIADQSKLQYNLNIPIDDKEKINYELMTDEELMEVDEKSKIDKNLWVFPVCAYNHNLDDNVRAVFEKVKNDKEIKKIVLYRSKLIDVEGENVDIVPLYSRKAQEYLLQSYVLFIKHSPIINIPFPLNSKKHKFINLWHGIPLKRIGVASLDTQKNLDSIINNHNKKCHSVIASSDIDRVAMAASFYPLKFSEVWTTGLPRHDFITKKESRLPSDLKKEIIQIRKKLKGRKLILFAPTFRNDSNDGYYFYTLKEKRRLYQLLEDNNAVLGIREHMADSQNAYSNELKSKNIIDLSSKKYPNIEILYRLADILITDYSSCFIDFMLTGKPMLSFAYDLEKYAEKERGFFYDIEMVFPGQICRDFDMLYKNLDKLLVDPVANNDPMYDFKRRIFFNYIDSKNSKRLVEKVKEMNDK